MARTKRHDRIKQLHTIIDAERKRIFQNAVIQRNSLQAEITACGECGFTWDNAAITDYTPAPSGRCPFEYIHEEVRELRMFKAKLNPQWLHRADCSLEW